ncbi:hypothetical protein [Methanosarcina barkeri]|uniref:hypothetical protein n=1 Tax=Methanosarcina barkeri TaxID=2208 RepID=UPI000ACBA6E8|nr:hypothetical protein [Methanosarcina barkeri]
MKEDESVEKGNDFEKYVVNLFDDKYFSIVQWSTDIMRKHDRFVESDTDPDLIVRYLPKDEVFFALNVSSGPVCLRVNFSGPTLSN